ncbi:MAG TPA: DUF885 domain-containing protein [bacterium]|nr:DUF885 domain-containing protein [bacterium]
MFRPSNQKISGALLVATLATAALALGPLSAHSELDSLGRQAYRVLWEFHPVNATCSGFHEFDGRLGDYSPARVATFRLRLNRFLARLDSLDTLRLSIDDRIDRLLLISNLKVELFWLDRVRLLECNPQFYSDECIGGVYYVLLRDFAPLPDRARRAAARLEDVPRFIKQARANIKSPPKLYAEAAIDELKDAEDFFRESATEIGRQVPDLSARLAADADRAAASVRAWRTELETALPGLKDSFAMGKTNFDYLLATDEFLDFDSDSLLLMGENLLAQTDSTMKALHAQESASISRHPLQPPEDEPAPPGFSKQDILADEQAEVDSMRAWVEQSGYATVPAWVGPVRVVETPPFLRRVIPGIAMEGAAPLDSVPVGYMYIPPLPDRLDSAQRIRYYNAGRRHGYRGGIVHEGLPGHHLQISIANHNPSFIRKLQSNTCLIEGWALYCEQMVVEQGLYPPDSFPALRWLGGVKFRAARIIVDAGLHTGRMSYDDAWRFMVAKLGPDTAFFKAEVRRYCLSPSQPMSYLVGKTQLLALREAYRRKMGDRFSLKDFHDRVLTEGSIPVSLIRRKLLSE